MLWAAINSGPWVFRAAPETMREWIHYVRTAFPLAVLLLAPLAAIAAALAKPQPSAMTGSGPAARSRGAGLPGPLKLWLVYGIVATLASVLSPDPLGALYWGACYLAVFAALAAFLRGGDRLERAVQLNYLTWAVTTGILAILCVVARHVLYNAAESNMSSYGVMAGVGGSVGGMAMSRSSGMARFAAVPAVVACVMLWCDRAWWRRVVWAALFAATCLLVYMMQSRGAIFSLAFALVVVGYVLGVRARLAGIALVILAAVATTAEIVPQETTERVVDHVTRGESPKQLATMTGRTRDWAQGWKHIERSPIVGHGFQTDRWLCKTHIHNTYLYVLLAAGIVGLVPFVLGLGWAWLAAYRALADGLPARLGQQAIYAQAVGILAFFTLRSIPEVSGGLFSVDLMVMLPAIAYLGALEQGAGSRERGVGPVR